MSAIKDAIVDKTNELNRHKVMLDWLTENEQKFAGLSDSATINSSGDQSIWLLAYNRDDLQIYMSTAQLWNKGTEGAVMTYSTETASGVKLIIRARDGALPPTCKIVRRTETIPAQPAYERVFEQISCDV